MVKTKKSRRSRRVYTAPGRTAVASQETDGVYILKLAIYLIIGSLWLRITWGTTQLPIPAGAIVGLIVARSEKLGLDRKIEYAILLLSMFIGFWLPLGIEIVL
ncbi:MAG: hypothetical protein M3Q14_00460 [bacterium]|nr:hypothetical protein [bacterium]